MENTEAQEPMRCMCAECLNVNKRLNEIRSSYQGWNSDLDYTALLIRVTFMVSLLMCEVLVASTFNR